MCVLYIKQTEASVLAVAVCMNVVIVVIVVVTAAVVACTIAVTAVLAVVIVSEHMQMALYAISLVMFSSVLFVCASVYQLVEHTMSHFISC